MLIDWIKNRNERNQTQITEYLVQTIKHSLLGILECSGIQEKLMK